MHLIARAATTLVTMALVVGGTAAAANAQATTIRDKASDVLSFTGQANDDRGTQLGYSQSIASGVDLRSMRVKHTKKSVSVNLKFSDLDVATTVYVSLRVNGKSTPSRFLVNTEDETGIVINSQGSKRCNVPLTTRTGRSGSINAVIKRSCLGDPKKIKASVFAADQGYFADDAPYLIDPLSPNGVRDQAWTKWLKAS
jgi:hypothetical protein